MPDVTVLDVGHGNCSVITNNNRAIIVDAAVGDTLLEFLDQRDIHEIDAVLISHADADHIAGVISLLAQPAITVYKIYANPEPLRDTDIWEDFRLALADARQRGVVVETSLTTISTSDFDQGDVKLEILAPVPENAISGAGGRDISGRRLTANSMSAVIRVMVREEGEVLLTGDLDIIGLDNLLKDYPSPQARVLVFPHHGGKPRQGSEYEFAKRLCEKVKPEVVIFSIGRGMHSTPRPEIIKGVKTACPDVHIACTQLSQHCASLLPTVFPTHLNHWPSRGKSAKKCCAGTIEMNMNGAVPTYNPLPQAHRNFIETHAPGGLCQAPLL